MDIRSALNKLNSDVESEKWRFLQRLIVEALNVLNDSDTIKKIPKYKLRELILAPIQVSLESTNQSLNSDALIALEVFIDSEQLYEEYDESIGEKDFTSQFIDTIWPCPFFSEATQIALLTLVLRLCLFPRSQLNVSGMLRIVQICTDTYKRFMYSGLRDKAAVVRATLVQSIEAFVTKNNDVEGESMNSTSKYVYSLTSNDQVSTTDASDPKLQILGLLKCLIDALLPENITPRNRLSVPIYLEAIAIIISLLPLTIINQRMFLNIIWQRLCPMVMWFLGNQKKEHKLTSTLGLHSTMSRGVERIPQGTAGSVAAPDLWPEALKSIYDIVRHLTFLVGPMRELRPILESVYHQMLLYPPALHRLEALKGLTRILGSPEGILCVAGPLSEIPSLANNANGPFKVPSKLKKNDLRLLIIILESIRECSATKDQALVCASAKCVGAILTSLSGLLKGEGILEDNVNIIESQLDDIIDVNRNEIPNEDVLGDAQLPDASLPRTLEVDRWAAHDYILSLIKVLPLILDAQSTTEIDEILLDFSSSYARGRRSYVSGGVLNPLDEDDFADKSHIYTVNGTLLNADAVYAATFGALTLNYRLLQAGFYSKRNKPEFEVMSETDFLESILGAGLLIYVSETWLSQVYREIRQQDILTPCGLSPLLLRTRRPIIYEEKTPRGSHLVRMISEYDGIGWVFAKETCGSGVERPEAGVSMVGRYLISGVLHFGWDYIVESLLNVVALAGMCVDRHGRSSFFVGQHPTQYPPSASALENSCESSIKRRSLFQSLLRLLAFPGSDDARTLGHCKLAGALSCSLSSLRILAFLASSSLGSSGLQARCSIVFALLNEYSREATAVVTCAINSPLRIHPTQALNIDVVLAYALELGCQSSDCWVHLLNACQLVHVLKHAFLTSMEKEQLSQQPFPGTDDLPGLMRAFYEVNSKSYDSGCAGGGLLTPEQTGMVLSALSARVDAIFATAAERLSLPTMLDFLSSLLHASGAELAVGGQPKPTTNMQTEPLCTTGQLNSVVGGISRAAKYLGRSANKDPTTVSSCEQTSGIFLNMLGQMLLKAIRSSTRPTLYLLRAWTLVSQHLVDACCFSSRCDYSLFASNSERFYVSRRALACLHECITTFVISRPELPFFSSNEMFCKPFEVLLRLEMCDAELQDRIITCVSNVVESASSYLHSGWRPLFATLRSIKVPFLIEVVDRSSRAMSCPPEASVEICLDGDDAGEAPVFSSWRTNQLRVKTVLDIVEVFLSADDMLVFCNMAVDCVRCLLRYLTTGKLACGNSKNGTSLNIEMVQQQETALCEEEISCVLCTATLPLLARCCDVFRFIWAARTSPMDYILRSAKRQVHLAIGGPPQFTLLPSVCSFTSPILQARINNLTPWFSVTRLMEPNLQSVSQRDPGLWTLRSLDEIDQPSGGLHLWFLTLAGLVESACDCHPRVHRDVFEAFVGLLCDSVEAIEGETSVNVTRIHDGIGTQETIVDRVAVGASFAVFVVNHALLPRLQTAITESVSLEEKDEYQCPVKSNKENAAESLEHDSYKKSLASKCSREDDASTVVSKLCFSIGQSTKLVSNLITRFQKDGKESTYTIVGINLMLHQCLRVLVDGCSIRNSRISRLSTSSLRYLLIAIAPCLDSSQWQIATAHLEEAFRASLMPIHILTTIYAERSIRSLTGDAGLQLANLTPITDEDKLYQLSRRWLQLPEQIANIGDGGDECEEEKIPSYSFEFRVFPLCSHEVDRRPVDVVHLTSVLTSLLNTRLLICLICEIMLGTDKDGPFQKLLLSDGLPHSHTPPNNQDSSRRFPKRLSNEDFLSLVPVESYLRLLNCLSDCYTAFFDFDQFEDLKRAIQKLIKLPAPANMYQHSNLSSKILQVILLQALPSELATNFLATLAESTRSSFTDFDSNITKLRQSNFSRLPMQKPAAKVVGAFISPLPWLKPLIPVIEVNNVTEKFGLLFTGVSVHLTQYYLYLLHIRNKNDFMLQSSPFKRSQSLSGSCDMMQGVNAKISEVAGIKRGDLITTLVENSNRRSTLNAAALLGVNENDSNEKLTHDLDARIASLSNTLRVIPEGFLVRSTLNIQSVFTTIMARLIAVSEHPSLRQALASWSLHLVQNDDETHSNL